jgi:hypothetical protein
MRGEARLQQLEVGLELLREDAEQALRFGFSPAVHTVETPKRSWTFPYSFFSGCGCCCC